MIASLKQNELQEYFKQNKQTQKKGIRVLFVPRSVTDDNIEQVAGIYEQIKGNNYETVVILEPAKGVLDKKIPMPSASEFKTRFGVVPVNEKMRDEFCDEEDDFFIDDSGLHENMSLFDHLIMLQNIQEDFNVVSVQLADERLEIVDEVFYVFNELLAGRNVLLICACDLDISNIAEFERVREIINSDSISTLKNYLYSGQSKIGGVGVFIVGVSIAKAWELDIAFYNDKYLNKKGNSLINGIGGYQLQ